MNRQLRRLTSVALSLTLAIPVAAQSQESPFPVSTGLYGAVVLPQPEVANYYGRFDHSSGGGTHTTSLCTPTGYTGPAFGGGFGGGGGGKGALIVLPVLLGAIAIVAITSAAASAINNEICRRSA